MMEQANGCIRECRNEDWKTKAEDERQGGDEDMEETRSTWWRDENDLR